MTMTNQHQDAITVPQELELEDVTGKARGDDDDDDEEKQGLLLPVTTVAAIPDETTTSTTTTSTPNHPSGTPVWNKYGAEMKKELPKIVFVALPAVLTQFCLFSLFPIATSSVGRHLSSEELAGYGLGALMGNFSCLSVIMGALSAADTLMPRAYAAQNYQQMGTLAVRSVVVCGFLLFLPILLLSQTQWTTGLMSTWGTERPVAIYASNWMRVYALGIPATMLFRTIQRFCVTQERPWPPVQASILVTFVLHPLLLDQWVTQHGLLGSACAIVVSQYSMLTALIGILVVMKRRNQAFHVDSWPRLLSLKFWAKVVQWRSLWAFVSLAVGGVVGKSEWW